MEDTMLSKRNPKVFISHSHADKEIVAPIVHLFQSLKVRSDQLFCSSYNGYGIPLGDRVYDYIKKEFDNEQLLVIMVLSKNYYNSAACLNEMGAAWVKSKEYYTLLVPGFDYKEVKGMVPSDKLHFLLDSSDSDRKGGLDEFVDKVCGHLGIEPRTSYSSDWWKRTTDSFFDEIDKASVSCLQTENDKHRNMMEYEGSWIEIHTYDNTVATCELKYENSKYVFKGTHYGKDRSEDVEFTSRSVWKSSIPEKENGFEYMTGRTEKTKNGHTKEIFAYGYTMVGNSKQGIMWGKGRFADKASKKCKKEGNRYCLEYYDVLMYKINPELIKEVRFDGDDTKSIKFAKEVLKYWKNNKERYRLL